MSGMGTITEALRSFWTGAKIENGRCENLACRKPLRDDAQPINGFQACSEECAHQAHMETFI